MKEKTEQMKLDYISETLSMITQYKNKQIKKQTEDRVKKSLKYGGGQLNLIIKSDQSWFCFHLQHSTIT